MDNEEVFILLSSRRAGSVEANIWTNRLLYRTMYVFIIINDRATGQMWMYFYILTSFQGLFHIFDSMCWSWSLSIKRSLKCERLSFYTPSPPLPFSLSLSLYCLPFYMYPFFLMLLFQPKHLSPIALSHPVLQTMHPFLKQLYDKILPHLFLTVSRGGKCDSKDCL